MFCFSKLSSSGKSYSDFADSHCYKESAAVVVVVVYSVDVVLFSVAI